MSRIHLGMKRPLKKFNECYIKFLKVISDIERYKPEDKKQKEYFIKEIKQKFNDCLIQLNNIKNTQIDYLEKGE